MARRREWFVAVMLGLALGTVSPAATHPIIRIQPGQDVQAALDAAPPGAVLVLEPGLHRGPVVVPHPLTLRGEPGAALVGDGTGSVVTVAADDVRLESFAVTHSGRRFADDDAGVLVLGNRAHIQGLRLRENLHGIYVRAATAVQLTANQVVGLAATEPGIASAMAQESRRADGIHHDPPSTQALMGNGLHLFNADQAVVTDNHIHHVRDGIYVAHTSEAVFRGNRVHDSRYGIHYMYSSNNVIENNELWRNVAGPALMFSRNLTVARNLLRDHAGFRAYGLLLQDVDLSDILDNEILGNRAGLRLQHSTGNRFVGNRVAGNLSGLSLNSSSRDNVFTRNAFGFNLHQVELSGPVPPTEWSVEGVGNYWHSVMPLDLTGDGVSEWLHHEVDLMAERRETFPPVQLLIGSPGLRVIEWALSRAPVPGMRYITDPHPLTRERADD